MYRSTKGASKARRDQINAEIRNLKDLLPISDVDKARLSYLHIMSMACMYTRKSVFFNKDAPSTDDPAEESFFSFDELSELMHEMPGFLLLLTGEGRLLFLSDSVSEHLGHSMVDLVAQGDSVYDIIDPTDHYTMRSNLVPPTTPETDRLFRCHFNASKSVRRQSAGNKLVLIRARCLTPPAAPSSYWTTNTVWVCFCSPLDPHPPRAGTSTEQEPPSPFVDAERNLFLACFYSQHSRDMRLQEAQDSVNEYLGHDVETLRTRSWYSMLHPQDLTHASAQHCSLLREGGEGRADMVVRMETANHTWVWLYMVLQLEAGEHPIRSNNFVISESEAWSLRQQLGSEQSQLTLVLGSSSTSQQEGMSLQSPGGTLSSPDQVFTPGSSGLSGQSFDFSTPVCSEGQPSSSKAAKAVGEGEGEDPRSSLSSLEEESFFQQLPSSSEPLASPSAPSSPIPVTVATVPELDFLTQNILLPPSFQLEPPLPALPLPLPPVPPSQAQQTREFACTPPYTPQVCTGSSFPFGDPLFSYDPTGTTTCSPGPLTTTVTTTTASTLSQSSSSNPTDSPPPSTTLSTLLLPPLSLTIPSTDLLFPVDPCSGTLYEKLPPTPDSPGDGDCTIMTLPEVRGPLYVDVPLGPFHGPPDGLLTPEASPGKQPFLSFFSLEPEREREKMEISLLAEHIGTLADDLYPDPLYSKLLPSSEFPPPTTTTPDPVGLDSLFSLLGDFYPIKSWKGLDLPIFPDEDSLFEERILESLFQDLATSPCPSPTSSLSSPSVFSPTLSSHSSSSSAPSSSPCSPTSPLCWHPTVHFDGASAVGVGHFSSVQLARRNQAVGCGATTERAPTPGDQANCEEEAEEVAMETEELPLLSDGAPLSPPLVASSLSASPVPVSPVQPGLPCAQSLLEELAALEPMFGAGASITPGLGQQPELYQLQCHPMPQCFHKDGSGSDPPF